MRAVADQKQVRASLQRGLILRTRSGRLASPAHRGRRDDQARKNRIRGAASPSGAAKAMPKRSGRGRLPGPAPSSLRARRPQSTSGACARSATSCANPGKCLATGVMPGLHGPAHERNHYARDVGNVRTECPVQEPRVRSCHDVGDRCQEHGDAKLASLNGQYVRHLLNFVVRECHRLRRRRQPRRKSLEPLDTAQFLVEGDNERSVLGAQATERPVKSSSVSVARRASDMRRATYSARFSPIRIA